MKVKVASGARLEKKDERLSELGSMESRDVLV
jgi:hypothetical protein